MKILRLGDPHVKPSNIKESDRLMAFVVNKCRELKIDRLEILGDLFDTHSIVRLEVLEFWQKWLKLFSEQLFSTIVLVGNHDLIGSYDSTYSALHVFKELPYCYDHDGRGSGVKIVYEPFIEGKFGYLPYIHDNKKFVEEANKLAIEGATVLISHPNYEGTYYDNGSPITDAVDPNSLDSKFLLLIGGHIHTEQELNRIWLTGTARWLTKSCANKRKGIWLCEHDVTGAMTSKEFISTESVCTPIVSLTWSEGQERPEIPERAKVDIELIGSSDWVTKQKLELKNKVAISSKITDIKKSRERKSGKSLHEFLSNHYQVEPEKRQKLIKYLEGLKLVG